MKTLVKAVSFVVLFVFVGGCNNATVTGKVLSGDLGRVIRVSETDPRLEDEGLGGVNISLMQGGNQSRALAVLAKGTTKDDGTFKLTFSNDILRAGRILVRADSESVFKVQNLVEFPREGESLLVQVVQRKNSPESDPENVPE